MIRAIILCSVMLSSGALLTLSAKWQNETFAPGASGRVSAFNHPILQSLIFFIGLSILLPVYLVRCCIEKRRPRKLWEMILILPSSLDVLNTLLGIFGLLWIPASVWQMINGAVLVFGAIFSKIILKRQLSKLHFAAVAVATIALVIGGAASLLNHDQGSVSRVSTIQFIVGVVLVSVAQIVAALHMVVEEKLISSISVPFESDHIVGIQGINGIFAMALLLFPARYIWIGDAPLDDFIDGCIQIYNSLPLTLLMALFILSVAAFNYAAVEAALRLSTVHRALFDCCRMITVWLISIGLYYTGVKDYGESWEEWSWMQLLAILLLVAATVVYNLLPHQNGASTSSSSSNSSSNTTLNIQDGSSYKPIVAGEEAEKLPLLPVNEHKNVSNAI